MVVSAINTKTSSPQGQHCQKPNLSSWQATQAEFRHLHSKRAAKHPVQAHDWMGVSLLACYHASTHLEQQCDPNSASLGWAALNEAQPGSTGHVGGVLSPT